MGRRIERVDVSVAGSPRLAWTNPIHRGEKMGALAKQYANAYLDLCWCHVLSESITRQSIHEIIEMVPVNKVMGFGGDYVMNVENVYGHLVMARETLAEALAERMAYGRLDMEGAEQIARLWFHDNPASFYNLSNE